MSYLILISNTICFYERVKYHSLNSHSTDAAVFKFSNLGQNSVTLPSFK